MSNVIPFNKQLPPKEPKCSFCGTEKSKAKHMVAAGDGKHHICDKCIAKATKLLQDNQ